LKNGRKVPPGFGLRQPSAAFKQVAGFPKRQKAAAVQDASRDSTVVGPFGLSIFETALPKNPFDSGLFPT